MFFTSFIIFQSSAACSCSFQFTCFFSLFYHRRLLFHSHFFYLPSVSLFPTSVVSLATLLLFCLLFLLCIFIAPASFLPLSIASVPLPSAVSIPDLFPLFFLLLLLPYLSPQLFFFVSPLFPPLAFPSPFPPLTLFNFSHLPFSTTSASVHLHNLLFLRFLYLVLFTLSFFLLFFLSVYLVCLPCFL